MTASGIPSVGPDQLAQVCEEAARAGGRQLREWRDRFETREKAPADLVTDADLASQRAIAEVVRGHFPLHAFLGEEGGGSDSIPADNYCWVVDPLDGTTNYVHGYESYAVSIGVAHRGEILAGVIYDPIRDDCYRAIKGGGAWRNDSALRTSDTTQLSEALVAVSLPPRVEPDSPDLLSFTSVVPLCRAIRRTGSCAMNLAHVASGVFDAFWASFIHPWDVAAGVLLVREAGGIVTDVRGEPFDLPRANFAAAANGELHQQLLPRLKY